MSDNINPQQFIGQRKTSRYRPSVLGGWRAGIFDGKPLFSLGQVERMLSDGQVQYVLRILRAPLAHVEFEVASPNRQVQAFAENQIKDIWQKCVTKLARCFEYGYAAGELTYKRAGRQIVFDDLFDVHPLDARPLQYRGGQAKGKLAGVRINSASDDLDSSSEIRLAPPHSFWFSGEAKYGSYYGVPRLSGMFESWMEKSGRNGAKQSRQQWYHKNAYRGGFMRYPDGVTDISDNPAQPIYRNNQDLAREIVEKFENGGVLALPNEREGNDGKGEYKWQFEPPATHSDVAGLRDYPKDLDTEMLIGGGVPPELVQASTVGSGYSGRSIPAQVFFTSMDEVVTLMLRALIGQPMDWLVLANYGKTPYSVRHKSLAQMVAEDPAAAKKMMGGGQDDSESSSSKGGLLPFSNEKGVGKFNPATGRRYYSARLGLESDTNLRERVRQLASLDYPDLASVQLGSAHAPAGGVSVAGKEYSGGQFIPADVVAKATPEEKEAIEGKESLKGRLERFKKNKQVKSEVQAKKSEREARREKRDASAKRAENAVANFADSKPDYTEAKSSAEAMYTETKPSAENAIASARTYASSFSARLDKTREELIASGVTDKELSSFDSKANKAKVKVSKLLDQHEKLIGKYSDLLEKTPKPPEQPIYPEEPVEPDEPYDDTPFSEPSPDEYEDQEDYQKDQEEYDAAQAEYQQKLKAWESEHKEWERNYARWEKSVEKMDSDYEKSSEKYEQAAEKHEEKLNTAGEAVFDHWNNNFEPFLDESHAELSDELESVFSELSSQLDNDESLDQDQEDEDQSKIEEEDDEYKDYREEMRLGWSPDQSRTGSLKAVGTGEHQGQTLYGQDAERALAATQDRAGDSSPHPFTPKNQSALLSEMTEIQSPEAKAEARSIIGKVGTVLLSYATELGARSFAFVTEDLIPNADDYGSVFMSKDGIGKDHDVAQDITAGLLPAPVFAKLAGKMIHATIGWVKSKLGGGSTRQASQMSFEAVDDPIRSTAQLIAAMFEKVYKAAGRTESPPNVEQIKELVRRRSEEKKTQLGWEPYTNPEDGRQGWISEGRLIRYQSQRPVTEDDLEKTSKQRNKSDQDARKKPALSPELEQLGKQTNSNGEAYFHFSESITQSQIEEIHSALDSIPIWTHEKLQANGVVFSALGSIPEVLGRDLATISETDSDALKMTAMGSFSPRTKRILAVLSIVVFDEGKPQLIPNPDLGGTIREEYGHAIDDYFAKLSSTEIFLNRFREELATTSQHELDKMSFLNPSADEAENASELFAVLAAIVMGGWGGEEQGERISQSFPRCKGVAIQAMKNLRS